MSERVRLWILNAAVAAAVAGLWPAVAVGGPVVGGFSIPAWALVIGFVIAERLVVHVHFRRSAHSLTLSEIPLVLGLLAAEPSVVVLAWVAGGTLTMLAQRGLPPVRLAFNVVMLGLSAEAAALTYRALAPEAMGPGAWLAAVAGALVSAAGSAALITLAMSVAEGPAALGRGPRMLMSGIAIATFNASTAVGIAAVLAADPRAAVFLLGPATAVFLAVRASSSAHERQEHLEFLYETANALARAPDRSAALGVVLARAAGAFRAEAAEAYLLARGDEPALMTALGEGDEIRLPEPVADDVAGAVVEAVRDGGAVIVSTEKDASTGGTLAAHLRSRGIRDAMIAPLGDAAQPVGALVVANRTGVDAAFARSDLRLFETLARHTAAHVVQHRLEDALADLQTATEDLRHRAFHDALTGLANRVLLLDRIEHALARRQGNVVLIYIDLDGFKPINDTYGHEAGDRLLIETGRRLRQTLRDADTPARLGGDEFAVLLTDVAEKDARTVARRILEALRQPVDIGAAQVPIQASMGIALAPSKSIDAAGLMRNADAAMYASKHEGGKDFRVHSSGVALPTAPVELKHTREVAAAPAA